MRKGNFKATWKSLYEEYRNEDRTLRENQKSTNSWKKKC